MSVYSLININFIFKNKIMETVPNAKAKLIVPIKTKLGEGAIWNHLTQELYWLDIDGRQLFIYNLISNTQKTIDLPQKVGTVVPMEDGNAMVALEDGIYHLNLKTEELTIFSKPEGHPPNLRFNDGKCDPVGRLWVGSIWERTTPHVATLYKIESDGTSQPMLPNITISNGIAWSLDSKTMYYIDTYTSCVQAYNYEVATGQITNARTVITVPVALGYPDGMTIDAEGMLWIALWNGSAVCRFNPNTGKLLQKIEVNALNITSCAFGGADLKTLYITTASVDMTPEQHEKYPQAGSLFAVETEVSGVPCFYFG